MVVECRCATAMPADMWRKDLPGHSLLLVYLVLCVLIPLRLGLKFALQMPFGCSHRIGVRG